MAYAYLTIVALIAAGGLAVSIKSNRELKQTLKKLRREFQQQIDMLSAKVQFLEGSIHTQRVAASTLLPLEKGAELGAAQVRSTAPATEEITAETLAKIADTVTALIGKKAHIRSVKILQQENAIVSSWAQEGRVVIQASHNLAQRAHE
jgi:hypothetical protein